MPESTNISKAIISTLSYHSKFNYPLTFDELHRFLVINRPLSSNEVKKKVDELVNKRKIIKKKNYYSLPFSFFLFPSSFNLRRLRAAASDSKLRFARRAARLIGCLPWVKLVCVTGSLAMENSDESDDIDLMIVTSQNRLWLIRPFVILLVSLFFKRRKPMQQFNNLTMKQLSNSICLNLWLDESYLEMPPHRRDLRTAHELAQMKPVINKNHTYEKMMYLNNWGREFLANTWERINSKFESRNSKQIQMSKIQISKTSMFRILNLFLFRLQLRYMSPRRTTEEVNLHSAFFHPSEHSENSESQIS